MTLHTLSKGHLSPLEELLLIRTQFAALKALAYRVQALEPAELSAQWDALHKSSRVQYEEMETTIRNFVSPGRWQPRFIAYYVLPIVLHVVKSVIFFSWIGLPGVLLYDVLVLLILGAARHPYAVSMTLSYSSDLDALPQLAKATALWLSFERLCVVARHEYGLVWGDYVPRLDMLPVYTGALCAYAVYALCHQAYTLYWERSWEHRRAWDVALSLISHQVNNVSFLIAYYYSYEPESVPYLVYTAYMLWMYVYRRGVAIQPNFYTSHRLQHLKELYPFCHKYHHIGHPATPLEAQDGGLMEFWAAPTGFLVGARTGWYGWGGVPTPLGFITRHLRVASAHGLWLGFLQTRSFHDLCCQGQRYFVASRENPQYRAEGEKPGAHIPSLHYYHHLIPDQQFSYDSYARLDLVFGTQHKAAEVLYDECRHGAIKLD
jgi:hypothetical protein